MVLALYVTGYKFHRSHGIETNPPADLTRLELSKKGFSLTQGTNELKLYMQMSESDADDLLLESWSDSDFTNDKQDQKSVTGSDYDE